MANPLFEMLGNNQSGIIQQFQRFKDGFHGDAKAQVQQMLNSGRITQAQYDRAVKMANEMQRMMGIK